MDKFKVIGTLKETAEDVEAVVEATSYKEAERVANKMGILVTDILHHDVPEAVAPIKEPVSTSIEESGKNRPISNLLVWLAVLVPFIAMLFAWLHDTTNMRLITGDGWTPFRWGQFILILILLCIDSSRITKANLKPPSFIWAFLIYPFYLWKRATLLKDKRYYFLVSMLPMVLLSLAAWSDPEAFYSEYSGTPSFNYTNASYFQSTTVAELKTSSFSFCPTRTLDSMVNSYMANPTWEEFEGYDGNTYVNITGGITYNNRAAEALLQIVINGDSFDVNALEINRIPQNEFVLDEMLRQMCSSY